jgi:Coenzyme PQQ synthesis protein D (PqqD)
MAPGTCKTLVMETGGDAILRIREEELAWRRLDAEIVVLDIRQGTYLSINASGIDLWEMLVDGATRSQLQAHLVTTYELDPPRAAEDVSAFVLMLTESGLLQ